MGNVEIFETYFKEHNVYMDKGVEEDGSVFFRTREHWKNGGSVILVVYFDPLQEIIDIQIIGIAYIENPLKQEALHDLMNELNIDYRFLKFIEHKGNVIAQYPLRVEKNNLDPLYLVNMMEMCLNSAEDSYPKFMKLQWT